MRSSQGAMNGARVSGRQTNGAQTNGANRKHAKTSNGVSGAFRQLSLVPKKNFIDIELFAGAGGLTLGLAAAGLAPDHLFEQNRRCCATMELNAHGPTTHITGEIHEEDVASTDWSAFQRPVRLLSGGPPCQPFSLGGKHLADRDGRNQFPATLRAVRELRPAMVLLENVPGLARGSFRPYLDYIVRQLECPSVMPRKGELWEEHDRRLDRHQRSASCVFRPHLGTHSGDTWAPIPV